MARKTAAEAAQTRRRILEAAGDLFAREGVTSTTLEQIARQANLTRGAIYWHFKGKQDLLNALFSEQALPLECQLPQGVDFHRGWQQLHDGLVATVSGDMPRRLSEIMLYQGAYGATPATHQRRLTQTRQSFLEQLEALLESAVSRKELPSALDIPAVMGFFRLSITGLLYECLQDPNNPVETVSSALAVLREMLEAPPRHLLIVRPA